MASPLRGENETSVFTCICKKEYKTKAGLAQHVRRYCNGSLPKTTTCKYCSRAFNSYAGLRLHEKKAHSKDYNNELENESKDKKKFWSTNEERELAMLAINYTGDNLYDYLTEHSSRSREAIKKRFQNPAFKLILEEERNKFNVMNNTNIISNNNNSIINNNISIIDDDDNNIENILNSKIYETNDDLFMNYMQNNYKDYNNKEVMKKVCEYDKELAKIELDNWTIGIINKVKQKNKRNVKNINNQAKNINLLNRRKKRKALYKLYQRQYKTNRNVLAENIIEGKNNYVNNIMPSLNDIKSNFLRLFSFDNFIDDKRINKFKDTNTGIYTPITREEINWAIKNCRSHTAGPDGINKKTLVKIDIQDLEILFNSMLLLKYTPGCFAKSKTVLIPKGCDKLDDANNWRPITISSIFLRIINKIIAKRLSRIKLNDLQRGFRPIDGCLSNILTLHSLIKHRRKAGKGFVIISLDLKKAFDSVAHSSISRALRRLRVDCEIIKYINSNYTNASTDIWCGSQLACNVEVNKGVKQGDPLSPILFNFIIDELLEILSAYNGVNINNRNITCLGFADDLIITAENSSDAKILLSKCTEFFKDRGLNLNIGKCRAVVADTVPSKKKVYIAKEPIFSLEDGYIPQVGIEDTFKYLGAKLAAEGTKNYDHSTLFTCLKRIGSAPLKQYQKLNILVKHLIPRYISALQTPNITSKILKEVDKKFRSSIKKFLHLSDHVSNSIIYASLKDGGLGVFCFQKEIPLILNRRITNLEEKGELLMEPVYLSKLKAKLAQMANNSSSRENKQLHRDNFEKSYSGGFHYQTGAHKAAYSFLYDPPVYWKGEDYIKAIHLKYNMLPSKSIPYVPTEDRFCRGGCKKAESLSHIIQSCHLTHQERIIRHNFVAKRVVQHARRNGWSIKEEPYIKGYDGRYLKPDLILQKGNITIISDIAIQWESSIPLSDGYRNKTAIYSTEAFLRKIRDDNPENNIYVLPLIVGARGTWCSLNKFLLHHLGNSTKLIADIIHTTLRGGWTAHRKFMARVWR